MSNACRQERSRQRAEAYSRTRRARIRLSIAAVILYVVVPLVWNGCVEFGWVHPIRTAEFSESLLMVRFVLISIIVLCVPLDCLQRTKSNKPPASQKKIPADAATA
jgi:hypothetical protein